MRNLLRRSHGKHVRPKHHGKHAWYPFDTVPFNTIPL